MQLFVDVFPFVAVTAITGQSIFKYFNMFGFSLFAIFPVNYTLYFLLILKVNLLWKADRVATKQSANVKTFHLLYKNR